MRAEFSIGLAGAMSSGKSTLADEIASQLGIPLVGFGDFVRGEARDRGLEADRRVLQVVGAELLGGLGAEGFCRAAADSAGVDLKDTGVVWDGVRHGVVAEALRELQRPREYWQIGLRPPEVARLQRIEAEAGSAEELRAWERDSTERELDVVLSMADFVCEALNPEQALTETLAWIAKRSTNI
jgi:adenylate kinase family enzyme